MRQLRYYLDTSVWNFLLEEDRPEHRAATERFFQQIGTIGAIAISDVVLREIARAPGIRRVAINRLIQRYEPVVLQVTSEVQELAEQYISQQLIPLKYRDDALHIATAVVHEIDVIVSWNFEHMVRLKTRMGINGINRLLGYREIEIVSPEEVSES